MRIENIHGEDPFKIFVELSATRSEIEDMTLEWHDDCQIVGPKVWDLLNAAADYFDDKDDGEDWSTAITLREIATDAKKKFYLEEYERRHNIRKF